MNVAQLEAFGKRMARWAVRRRLPFWREEEEIAQLAVLSALETYRRKRVAIGSARTYYFRAAAADITLALARRLVPVTIGERAATKRAQEFSDCAPIDQVQVPGGARPDADRDDVERRRARDQLVLMVRARTSPSDRDCVDRALRDEPAGSRVGAACYRLQRTLGQDPRAQALRAQMTEG